MAKKIKQEKKTNKDLLKAKPELNEEQQMIRKAIILFGVIVVIIVGVYFLSKLIVDKNETNNNVTEDVEIDYSITEVGTILNRPYKEYYVMVYNSTDPNASLYSSLITNYSKDTKIYFCDLDNGLNKEFISGNKTGNKNAKSVSEFSFGEITLLKIKNGKVVDYIEDVTSISKILK